MPQVTYLTSLKKWAPTKEVIHEEDKLYKSKKHESDFC